MFIHQTSVQSILETLGGVLQRALSEDPLNPTDMTSLEKGESWDSEEDSHITKAEVTEVVKNSLWW